MYTALIAETDDETRVEALRKAIDPLWTGIVAYRGLIPAESIAKENISAQILDGIIVSAKSLPLA